MENKRSVSRRYILTGGVSAVLASAVGLMLPPVQRSICGDAHSTGAAAWIDELQKNPAFRLVGAEYLDNPMGRNDPVVASGMEGFLRNLAIPVQSEAEANSSGEIRQIISARIRDDFAKEQVVRIGGWILSITEARLCAVIHVLA